MRLIAKEYAAPSSATSGLAGYALEGQRRTRLKAQRKPKTVRLVGKAATDTAAHAAATSPFNLTPQPSDAQIHANNYAHGHLKVGPFEISIENPCGSRRRPEWPQLTAHYGYIRRKKAGADGDAVDVFVRNGTPADFPGPAFIVDQVDPASGEFDERKLLLGWHDIASAQRAYLSNYQEGWQGLGAISELSLDELDTWLEEGDTTRPYALGKVLMEWLMKGADMNDENAREVIKAIHATAPAQVGETDIFKGDAPGHEFHGNQYGEGGGGQKEQSERKGELVISRVMHDGKPAVRVAVRGNVGEKGRSILDRLGMKPAEDISNTRERIVTTPPELDSLRSDLVAHGLVEGPKK